MQLQQLHISTASSVVANGTAADMTHLSSQHSSPVTTADSVSNGSVVV